MSACLGYVTVITHFDSVQPPYRLGSSAGNACGAHKMQWSGKMAGAETRVMNLKFRSAFLTVFHWNSVTMASRMRHGEAHL